MQAHEIMKKQVIKVQETSTVRSVIEKFIENRISGLPIVNEKNEITGYISDGDIMRYIGKQKDYIIDTYSFVHVVSAHDEGFEDRAKRMLDFNVLEIAKRRVIKVAADEELENIAAVLGKRQIKKLPVERDGVLVGIISRGDVVRDAFKTLL